jgi:hypothetical protein
VVPSDAGTYANAAAYHGNGGAGAGDADASLYANDAYANIPGSSTTTNA